ncbi:hypothetical protein [Amaricoccus sp.]|uniref:hypothetical protein n=1 Tax=Amaricoccus sp. TaxID=1872485 RepID=UPI001B4C11FE|nr:hypothetical protein [Amaricoccus sp.]MBP7000239.1 hypothetical protein [Amaricoccus sp.]
MTRAPLVALLVAAAASPGLAESVVAPDAFEAMSVGRTLHFTLDGQPFGSEQFFPGRRTLWRYAEEGCQRGVWRAEGAAICFAYEGMEGAICWRFLDTGAGHAAALVEGGAETGFRLKLDHIDAAPLDCPGPEVGS